MKKARQYKEGQKLRKGQTLRLTIDQLEALLNSEEERDITILPIRSTR
jgi:hypothetical protein